MGREAGQTQVSGTLSLAWQHRLALSPLKGLNGYTQVSLFKALDKEQLAALKETMRIIALREGTRLFDMGQAEFSKMKMAESAKSALTDN